MNLNRYFALLISVFLPEKGFGRFLDNSLQKGNIRFEKA